MKSLTKPEAFRKYIVRGLSERRANMFVAGVRLLRRILSVADAF